MKRVFITGASSGIGLATAKLLAGRGDEVWGTSRDIARIPQLPRLHPVRLDLSDNVSLGESFNAALREAGHFDVVINNAGSGHFGPAEFLSAETVQTQFQTLVFAHIELCRLALASMRTHGSGCIINVTSLASRVARSVHERLQRGQGCDGFLHHVVATGAGRVANSRH